MKESFHKGYRTNILSAKKFTLCLTILLLVVTQTQAGYTFHSGTGFTVDTFNSRTIRAMAIQQGTTYPGATQYMVTVDNDGSIGLFELNAAGTIVSNTKKWAQGESTFVIEPTTVITGNNSNYFYAAATNLSWNIIKIDILDAPSNVIFNYDDPGLSEIRQIAMNNGNPASFFASVKGPNKLKLYDSSAAGNPTLLAGPSSSTFFNFMVYHPGTSMLLVAKKNNPNYVIVNPTTMVETSTITLEGTHTAQCLGVIPQTNFIIIGTQLDNIEVRNGANVFQHSITTLTGGAKLIVPLNTSNQFLASTGTTKNMMAIDVMSGVITENYSSDAGTAGAFKAAAINSTDQFFIAGGGNKKVFLFTGTPPPVPCIFNSQVEISPGVCQDCLMEADFTSNLADCQGDANVKFYQWSVSLDNNQNQTPKLFRGKLTISGYDLPDLVPLTAGYFNSQTQVSFSTPGLNASLNPSFSVVLMPASIAATLEIEFSITLTQPLTQNEAIEFTFGNYNVHTNGPLYVNLVTKTTTPSITLPFCNPTSSIYSSSTCESCINPADYPTNTLTCASVPTFKYYPWVVETDAGQTDDALTYYGIFKIQNYDWPNVTPMDLSWFQANISVNYGGTVTPLGPTLTVTSVPTVPASDMEIPFRINLTSALDTVTQADQQITFTLTSNLLYSDTTASVGDYISLLSGTASFNLVNFFVPPPPASDPVTPENKPLEEYIGQDPDSAAVKIINSPTGKAAVYTTASAVVIVSVAGAFSFGCMNFSSAFIKLFQVIEIMSKFVYLPVWYKGFLLNVLFSISQIGELINAKPDTIAKTDQITKGFKVRYWTKFTLYGEYQNVLQAQPITCIALAIILLIKASFVLITKLTKKNPSCALKYINYFYSVIIEMTIVDLTFSCIYNLISDYQSNHTFSDNLGRFMSIVFLSAIILHYLKLGETVVFYPSKVQIYEKMVIFENLKGSMLKPHKKPVHLINIIFKLKLVVLMACIIMFQQFTVLCMVVMLLIQTASIANLIYLKKKFKIIFSGWVAALSYLFLEMAIFAIIVYTLFILDHKDMTVENTKNQMMIGIQNESKAEKVGGFLIVVLLVFTLLFEFLKIFIEIFLQLIKMMKNSKSPWTVGQKIEQEDLMLAKDSSRIEIDSNRESGKMTTLKIKQSFQSTSTNAQIKVTKKKKKKPKKYRKPTINLDEELGDAKVQINSYPLKNTKSLRVRHPVGINSPMSKRRRKKKLIHESSPTNRVDEVSEYKFLDQSSLSKFNESPSGRSSHKFFGSEQSTPNMSQNNRQISFGQMSRKKMGSKLSPDEIGTMKKSFRLVDHVERGQSSSGDSELNCKSPIMVPEFRTPQLPLKKRTLERKLSNTGSKTSLFDNHSDKPISKKGNIQSAKKSSFNSKQTLNSAVKTNSKSKQSSLNSINNAKDMFTPDNMINRRKLPDLEVIREHSEEITSKRFIEKQRMKGARTQEVKNLRKLQNTENLVKQKSTFGKYLARNNAQNSGFRKFNRDEKKRSPSEFKKASLQFMTPTYNPKRRKISYGIDSTRTPKNKNSKFGIKKENFKEDNEGEESSTGLRQSMFVQRSVPSEPNLRHRESSHSNMQQGSTVSSTFGQLKRISTLKNPELNEKIAKIPMKPGSLLFRGINSKTRNSVRASLRNSELDQQRSYLQISCFTEIRDHQQVLKIVRWTKGT